MTAKQKEFVKNVAKKYWVGYVENKLVGYINVNENQYKIKEQQITQNSNFFKLHSNFD